jgi:hypothetical protein
MKTPNYFVDRTRNSQLRKKSAAMHHGIVTIPPLGYVVKELMNLMQLLKLDVFQMVINYLRTRDLIVGEVVSR